MPRSFRTGTLSSLFVLCALTASAQLPAYNIKADRQERMGENHWLLSGNVEIEQADTKLYANEIEVFVDQERVLARGNVLLTQGNNRIASESADFNTRTHLGTFFTASGIANVQPPHVTSQSGGIIVPQMSGLETDVYFFGETVQKIGTKKYKITNGGFSACVQPTPRWDLSADTVVLNVDHYTLLRQAILKVKGVPMLYIPILYYPTKEDGRATGILIPTYASSTIRGHTIHNAFFWAINRSHDATFLYDWYSKTGTGGGAEYRYNMGGGSDGTISAYRLVERAVAYQQSDGSSKTQPASRSFTVNGGANQIFPGNLRARARVNYFSSIVSNQTFNTNVYDASRNNRSYGGNVVGAWQMYSLNGTFDRTEYFNSTTSSGLTGSSPRISFTRSDRPLFSPESPIYFGFGSELAHLDRQTKGNNIVIDDRSLSRLDFNPQVRYPFKKWQWFTVNTSLSWRETYYTRSLVPGTNAVGEADLNRQYFTAGAQAVGPVFTRVWNTPDNGYAERIKHTIEPYFGIQRTSAIPQRDAIVQVDGSDGIFGETTSVNYGLNNRLYAKRKFGQSAAQAQEIVSVEITQSYYTDARASQVDPRYTTSYTSSAPNHFSPLAINLRATPTIRINGTLRAEIDSKFVQLRTLSANGSYNWSDRVQSTIGWTHKFLIKGLSGFSDPKQLDHYINLYTNAHTQENKYGAIYSLNYDVLRSTMLQQRISAFYNAQCCGIAFEYQRYNLSGLPSSVVPADHRFFLSFTLAGLGNFSPFNGGLNGVPR